MNYYNPYYYVTPSIGNTGLFSSITSRGGLSLSTILNGAQRTLGLMNQAIPIIKEAAPMMRNAKTMFKVMNEFKKIEAPSNKENKNHKNIQSNNQNITNKKNSIKESNYDSGPIFFI